jgi:hypothetical protein
VLPEAGPIRVVVSSARQLRLFSCLTGAARAAQYAIDNRPISSGSSLSKFRSPPLSALRRRILVAAVLIVVTQSSSSAR